MADALVRAKVVPKTSATPVATLVSALLAQSMDAVVADPGADNVVSADIAHDAATDPSGATATAAINTAISTVGNAQLVGPVLVEKDPVLSSPSNVTLDVSDANIIDVIWAVTLAEGASLKSITVTATDLTGVSIPVSVIAGDPQGHESQKNGGREVRVRIGPSPAGGTVGSPHDLSLAVTDSRNRVSITDIVAVTVQA